MAARFIHTGDLHLGMKFKNASFNTEHANIRRRELWETFDKIIERAKKNEVDLLLIAGDLFEDEYCSIGDIKRINDSFRKLSPTKIIISAGNHDNNGKKSLYKLVDWPDNVYIFEDNNVDNISFEDINIVVWGLSWDKKLEKRNLADNIIVNDTEKINILLVHGDVFNKDSDYLPIDKNKIRNFHYVALGHIHKPQFISNRIAYCGSPEPLDFGETGIHGIIEGVLSTEKIEANFMPFNKRQFIIKDIAVNEDMGYQEIIDCIIESDSHMNREKNMYRIILKGIRDNYIDLDLADIKEELKNKFYYIELIDNTVRDYDLDRIVRENENNIIGYFVKEMKEKGLENPIIKDALYEGLEILLSEKVKK